MVFYLTYREYYADSSAVFATVINYLFEIKKMPETATVVHTALMNGTFVERRSDGHRNKFTINAAKTNWAYSKSVFTAASAHLKSVLHLNSNPHREYDQTRVDIQLFHRTDLLCDL